MCLADGVSNITESYFENRFRYVNELRKMGADIIVNGNIAVFNGGANLSGDQINATDLRAGAAMIIAGLVAEGTSEIFELKLIDRGYEKYRRKISGVLVRISKEWQTRRIRNWHEIDEFIQRFIRELSACGT